APLQLVELVPLRFGRIRNEQRREDLAERRIALTPAELDQLTERFSLRLRDERSARERAGQDQLADPLGMANGILDRDRAALRHAEQVEALYPQGVDDQREVFDPGVEIEAAIGPVRQPAAALVIANEGEVSCEEGDEMPPYRAFPRELEMREPVRGPDERRAVAVDGISEPYAVGRGDEAYRR